MPVAIRAAGMFTAVLYATCFGGTFFVPRSLYGPGKFLVDSAQEASRGIRSVLRPPSTLHRPDRPARAFAAWAGPFRSDKCVIFMNTMIIRGALATASQPR